MLTEKIQCFLFERKIKSFLSLVEYYNSCKKEYDEMVCPKIEAASGTLKCCDMFKNKNKAYQYDFTKMSTHETIKKTEKQIENARFDLFYNIPNNCVILTKNFKISMEVKTNELLYDEIPQDVLVEIEKNRRNTEIPSEQYFYANRKFSIRTRKYIIINKKEKTVYLYETTKL